MSLGGGGGTPRPLMVTRKMTLPTEGGAMQQGMLGKEKKKKGQGEVT